MSRTEYKIWDTIPGDYTEEPSVTHYKALIRATDATVVIFPGGGYVGLSPTEGVSFAEFFNCMGMDAFVVKYRVSPHRFPSQLLDARRAIRFVRANAEKFGIDPNRVAVMGSSAGGHLAALLCTYRGDLDAEGAEAIDEIDCLPNAQILCYPVICMNDASVTHMGSNHNLLGEDWERLAPTVSPNLIADEKTPKTFIWHTFDDSVVSVRNSLEYTNKLLSLNVPTELIIYPHGHHGEGLAPGFAINKRWRSELDAWLRYIGFIDSKS